MVSPQKISTYIRKPYALDAEAEKQLREVISEHPYFGNAWLLLTRSLHNQNSPKFEASLKQSSMYAGDRDLLYKLVNIEDSNDTKKPTFTDKTEIKTETVTPTQKVETAAVVEEPTQEKETKTPENQAAPVTETIEPPVVEQEVIETASTSTADSETTVEEDNTVNTIEETVEAIETSSIENKAEELAESIEETITDKVDETAETVGNEQEKVKSAYEEIFGKQEDKSEEETVSTEFETFDIRDRLTDDDPSLPDFDEEDFILQVDDNDSEDLLANALASSDIVDTSQKENEATDETTENINTGEVEENIAIAETEVNETAHSTENIGDTVSQNIESAKEERNELTENEVSEVVEELSNDLNSEVPEEHEITTNSISHEVEDTSETVSESIEAVAESNEAVSESIAFKLNADEAVTEEKSVVTEQPTIAEASESPTAASSFFEWLTQLKNPETEVSQKKNEIASEAISTEVSQSQQAPIYEVQETAEHATEKKSEVDDIIERFIKVNPTISRAKAEFYNPEVKSKESDTESDDLATETLAKIYRDQKLNDKAIDIYKRLSVIYPAKAAEYNTIIAEIENE